MGTIEVTKWELQSGEATKWGSYKVGSTKWGLQSGDYWGCKEGSIEVIKLELFVACLGDVSKMVLSIFSCSANIINNFVDVFWFKIFL